MKDSTKKNAARSGLVVVGALAFGYLTFQIGLKFYVEKAQPFLPQSDSDSDSSPSTAINAASKHDI